MSLVLSVVVVVGRVAAIGATALVVDGDAEFRAVAHFAQRGGAGCRSVERGTVRTLAG